nr:hypothetical protein [Desulfurococcales archaeon]
MSGVREVIRYLLWRTGCIHPFRASRILALAELRHLEDRGSRMTSVKYVSGPGTFFIEGLKELVEEDDCISKREGDPEKGVKGC